VTRVAARCDRWQRGRGALAEVSPSIGFAHSIFSPSCQFSCVGLLGMWIRKNVGLQGGDVTMLIAGDLVYIDARQP